MVLLGIPFAGLRAAVGASYPERPVRLVVPSVPAGNVKELIAFARARPGELQYASAGLGSAPHLMMALFNNMAGLEMIHVPYKGAGPALIDIMAGHVPMMVGNILSTRPLVRSGKVRSYGVTSARRSSAAPEIPTIAEGGLTGYDAATWFGILAPAATPRDIIAKLHDTALRALQDPAISSAMQAMEGSRCRARRLRNSADSCAPSPASGPK